MIALARALDALHHACIIGAVALLPPLVIIHATGLLAR
jgi:hypothetical protein